MQWFEVMHHTYGSYKTSNGNEKLRIYGFSLTLSGDAEKWRAIGGAIIYPSLKIVLHAYINVKLYMCVVTG